MDQSISLQKEVDQLREQVAALEQLLEVYEQETLDKSARLEQTLAALREHARQLSYSEEALRVLKSILASMGEGVVVADEHGSFLFVNPSAEVTLGIQPEVDSLISWLARQSQQSRLCLPDRTTPCPIAHFPLVQALQGTAVDATELYVPTTDATDGLWLSVTARPLQNDQGTTGGGVAVFHNITALKQSETALRLEEQRSRQQTEQLQQTLQALQTMQAKLVQSEKMSSLGQLVAGVAHEINNPINFIYGNVTPAENYVTDLLDLVALYQECYPNPEPKIREAIAEVDLGFLQRDLRNVLRSMRLGAERIRQIVLSLRNFSRLDEADMKPVNIHDGIDSTLLILQNRLKPQPDQPMIQVIKQYSDIPQVTCYPGQLNQVFMNILSNAIDALEEMMQSADTDEMLSSIKPTIWIRTSMAGTDEVCISITNNGPTIPSTQLNRLFDPFFTTKAIGKGTGLGLYISYQIVTETHDGLLECLSEPDEGVEFRIQIPIRQGVSLQV